MLAAVPSATILRPSIVFGPEDDFFNRFAAMARMSPALPLVGGGHTRFQPVFVGDVGSRDRGGGRRPREARHDLRARRAGGEELQGADAVRARHHRAQAAAGAAAVRARASCKASFLQFLPKPLLTPDQVELLRGDNVVSEDAKREGRTLAALGIEPVAMETIVPSYLWRFRKTGQFRPAWRSARDVTRCQYPSASAIRPSVPTMTRHQANSAKPWRCT